MTAIDADYVFALHPHGYYMEVVALDGRKLKCSYEKDILYIASSGQIAVLVKILHFVYQRKCLSCNSDVSVTLMHDHNPRVMISTGKISHG